MVTSPTQALRSAFHPLGVDSKPGAIKSTFTGAFNVAQDAALASVHSAVAQQPSRARLPGQLPFSGFNPFSPFATAYGTPNQQPRGMAGLGVSPYVASSFMPSLAAAAAAGFSGHPAIQGLTKDYTFSGFMRGMSAIAHSKEKLNHSVGLNGFNSMYRFDSSISDAPSRASEKWVKIFIYIVCFICAPHSVASHETISLLLWKRMVLA